MWLKSRAPLGRPFTTRVIHGRVWKPSHMDILWLVFTCHPWLANNLSGLSLPKVHQEACKCMLLCCKYCTCEKAVTCLPLGFTTHVLTGFPLLAGHRWLPNECAPHSNTHTPSVSLRVHHKVLLSFPAASCLCRDRLLSSSADVQTSSGLKFSAAYFSFKQPPTRVIQLHSKCMQSLISGGLLCSGIVEMTGPPRDHLAVSEDVFGCHWNYRVGVGDTAKHRVSWGPRCC